MPAILVIEDDVFLREELLNTFRKEGYPATGISSFDSPEQEILAADPALAVLDLNLPGRSGFELCRWFKTHTSVPVLILTARDTLEDELSALGLGADDFLTKPCHPNRLLARAVHLLQLYGDLRRLLRLGALSLDLDTGEIRCGEHSAVLPETEARILRVLMEQHPSLVSRDELFRMLWGGDAFVDENILQVNLSRLRRNLEAAGLPVLLRNVRGLGYCLEVSQP